MILVFREMASEPQEKLPESRRRARYLGCRHARAQCEYAAGPAWSWPLACPTRTCACCEWERACHRWRDACASDFSGYPSCLKGYVAERNDRHGKKACACCEWE